MPTLIETQHQPRYHVFMLDLGWRTEVSQVIHENLGVIHACMAGCPLYLLNPEQTLKILRRDPHLIGSDPCLIIHDLRASEGNGQDGYHGLRLSLGRAKNGKEALRLFQDFLRFAAEHQHSTDIERDVAKKLRREGLSEVVELLHHVV